MHSRRSISTRINGQEVRVEVSPRRLLADFLRHDLGLHGTHVGCEQGVCGACTVLVGGAPVRSCLLLAAQVDGSEVTTVEGLHASGALAGLEAAFHRHHALQCGFCTPGFLVSLAGAHGLDEAEIRERLSGNLCRCTGYQNIIAAVREFAGRDA
ncbi:MAG TPA: (2Fe-2S)-binding protein [Candidatus Dormibacteraeota bacterium]